jgi:hypothetical protein
MSLPNHSVDPPEAVPINPYFISFLGIISGLMSEKALESLRQWGESYFRGRDEQRERWARDELRQQFSEADRDLSVLKSILHVNDEQLNNGSSPDRVGDFSEFWT